MKKLLYVLVIISLWTASNCSKIPENNDPIIGIWSKEEQNEKNSKLRQEWIFNDAYLGRHHQYQDNQKIVQTDFKWSQEEGVYTLTYPGTEMLNDKVRMQTAIDIEMLEDLQGNLFALRDSLWLCCD
ncbi:hypothetical protein [Poritiphilus flavus]|uniref:Lipocalin-like domain-containing protein n=1 Tax=Poritiphilus flavus TaxID=2697053 RepID=A0A6L9E9G1_9FLAO|nr:hypothetical protein [Poritiphilus flavus]NAS11129.1 hypothetical protein [Poritiphilus flavus]